MPPDVVTILELLKQRSEILKHQEFVHEYRLALGYLRRGEQARKLVPFGWMIERPKNVIDLQKADLRNVDLSRFDSRSTILIGVRLESSDLTYALLDNANLQDAVIDHAKVNEASLRNTWLINTSFVKSDLGLSDFSGAFCTSGCFDYAFMDQTTFRDTLLLHASMKGADLSNAILSDSLTNTVDIENANLSGAKFEHPSEAYLAESKVSEAWAFEDNIPDGLSDKSLSSLRVVPRRFKKIYTEMDFSNFPHGAEDHLIDPADLGIVEKG